uniref:Striatin N-terminal domain-containing protein n=1 Tax=Strigamia maritima TaxID=126957 RepID=T1IWN9_STRMM
MASDALLFAFSLFDAGTLLFLSVYYVITLSDLECDYLNAQQCCSKLNYVNMNVWILPEMIAHGILTAFFLIGGYWIFFYVIFRCLFGRFIGLYVGKEGNGVIFWSVPAGNFGVYDPTEIHNRGMLKSHMKETMVKLGFYLIFFFIYLYSMIVSLLLKTQNAPLRSPPHVLIAFCNGGRVMMEDGTPISISQNLGGQVGPAVGPGVGAKQNHEEHNQRVQYSIPGILHFIQHEWARFEMERSQWEVERAELQLFCGRGLHFYKERERTRKFENDLVRRIKMLEYALKQERAKYHKLKYGTELNQGDIKPPSFDEMNKDEPLDGETMLTSNSNVTWRQGRQLLRQYLQEIGYTDTIIDVRSARVRSLLGLTSYNDENEENHNTGAVVNGEQSGKRANEQQGRRTPAKKIPQSIAEGSVMDSEASVLATFDFLASENVDMDEDDDNLSDEMEEGSPDDDAEERIGSGMTPGYESVTSRCYPREETSTGQGDFRDRQGELSPGEEWGVNPQLICQLKDQYRKEQKNKKCNLQRPKRSHRQAMLAALDSDEEFQSTAANMADPDNSAGKQAEPHLLFEHEFNPGSLLRGPGSDNEALGDLARLTVNNEADMSYDIPANKEAYRKTWNAKYTLRSHFDGVRALAFHPVEPVLITASEDHTLKLWNLQKTVPAKKTASLDVEPVYTFRAHVGPVLCLAMSATDPGVLTETLTAHSDSVWGLSIHSSKMQLLSCSADGTVRLWAPQNKTTLLNTYVVDTGEGAPTSVDFVRCDPAQMVTAFSSSMCTIYDLETGKPVVQLDNSQILGSRRFIR